MKTYKITGEDAIRIADRDGVTLHKSADPVDGYRSGIGIREARSVFHAGPGLIYCIVQPTGWTGPNDGRNVSDYFRGGIDGCALSGARYLGPDEDGIEPTWEDA